MRAALLEGRVASNHSRSNSSRSKRGMARDLLDLAASGQSRTPQARTDFEG
jgi:hypothetical protein